MKSFAAFTIFILLALSVVVVAAAGKFEASETPALAKSDRFEIQSEDQTLTFTSQDGLVQITDLRKV